MKKHISLIAAVLCLVMLLASCGATPKAKISDLLNTDYVPTEKVVSSFNQISELDGYDILQSNEYFAVFEKTTYPDLTTDPFATPTVSYKLFSMISGKVISTFAAKNTEYDFTLFDAIPLTIVEAEGEKITYTAYDVAGATVATSNNELEAPYEFADLIIFNHAAYMINDTAKTLTKTADVSEFAELGECSAWTEDYYLIQDDGSVLVYDRAFDLVYSWFSPSYVEDCTVSILNNGKLLVQYYYALDDEAKKYDFYETEDGHTVKYDLVTMIINPKNGKVTEKNVDFVVDYVFSAEQIDHIAKMFDESASDILSEKFENLAIVYYIEDRKINESDAAADIVLMSNKGEAKKSLKLFDSQIAPPIKVADGIYSIELEAGCVLVNEKGDVIRYINNNDITFDTDYIISDTAIYNYNFTKAYDLTANDAHIMANLEDSILIKAEKDDGYDLILLSDGKQSTVFTYRLKDGILPDKTKEFNELVGFNMYSIGDTTTGEYKYYNHKGDLIATLQTEIELVSDEESLGDTAIFEGMNSAGESTFYFFKTK